MAAARNTVGQEKTDWEKFYTGGDTWDDQRQWVTWLYSILFSSACHGLSYGVLYRLWCSRLHVTFKNAFILDIYKQKYFLLKCGPIEEIRLNALDNYDKNTISFYCTFTDKSLSIYISHVDLKLLKKFIFYVFSLSLSLFFHFLTVQIIIWDWSNYVLYIIENIYINSYMLNPSFILYHLSNISFYIHFDLVNSHLILQIVFVCLLNVNFISYIMKYLYFPVTNKSLLLYD